MAKLRIVVADDNPAFLQKLVSLLATEFEILATAANGKSALQLIQYYKPNLAVLDLGMPVLNGIDVAKELAKSPTHPPIVICSVENDAEIVGAAQSAGASAFVFKVRIESDLISAVKSALKGKWFMSTIET